MKPQSRLLALITFVATVSMPVSLTTQEVFRMSWLKFPASFSTSKVLAQTTEARKAEAERLFQQGVQQLRSSQFRETIQLMHQALTIYQKIGDRWGEGASLGYLGRAYDSLGQPQKAIKFYQQSLAIFREIEDRRAENDALSNLGTVYDSLGEYQKALELYQQSLAIFREFEDKQGEANSLGNLGSAYFSLGQYQKGIEFQQQSLAITKKIGDRQGEAISLVRLGNAYDSLGQHQKAIKFLQQSLAITRKIGDRQGEMISLGSLGSAYSSLGQYQKAIEFSQQSLAIAKEIGDRRSEANSLVNFGIAYDSLGQYNKAIEFYEQSLAIAREIEDEQGESTSLTNLGIVYGSLGLYQKAIELQQQSLAIIRKIGDRQGEAISLVHLGNAYRQIGQYQKAIEFYQQSLAIARKIEDRWEEANSIGSLASVYSSLGQYQKAIELYRQSLAITRKIKDKQGESASLTNLGILYDSLGQYQKAIEFHQQSLTLAKKIGATQNEANSLRNSGSVYSSLGQYQKAIEFYQQSLTLARKIGDRLGEGASLGNLGNVYASRGQHQKAIKLYQQSLTIIRNIGARQEEAIFLQNLGNAYNSLKQYADAERQFFDAIEIFESLRFPNLSDAEKISFFDTQSKVYRFLQYTLVAQNKTNAALEIAERGRARAFVELLASRLSPQADTQPTIAPPNSLQLQQIAAAHNATLVQYSIIYDPIKVQGKREWHESRLFIWVIPPSGRIIFRWTDLKPLLKNTSLNDLVPNSSSITLVNPDSPPIVTTSPKLELEIPTPWHHSGVIILLSLSGISFIGLAIWTGQFLLTKKNVQPQKTKRRWLVPSVFLFLAISSTGGLVLLINRTQSIAQNPSPRDDSLLAQFVSNTRASVSERETFFQKLLRGLGIVPKGKYSSQNDQLQQLHQILIDPIADLLPTSPNSPVIFIPQDSLFLVPFSALKDKDGKYLIEKHTILTAPSIQTLDLTYKQKLRNRESGNNGEALIVGNPTMPSVPPQIGEPPQKLPSLPGAEQEAKAIAKLLKTQPITGNQATKSAILKKMPSARIIHLATHGILDEQRGLGSAIALAPDSNHQEEIGEVNGLLTAEEILDLKLNASLVVLSACDTGRGRITGDGVVGLSRSLISAGVPSVLVSLWSVPDAPTAFLMTEFYRNWQHNPDKAQALRQAMLTTMKQHPNPRDWAAFTLIGEAE